MYDPFLNKSLKRPVNCYPVKFFSCPLFNIIVGKEVQQGEELGFIKFGSRVDVILPLGTKVNVELNQVVKGGVTVLATL